MLLLLLLPRRVWVTRGCGRRDKWVVSAAKNPRKKCGRCGRRWAIDEAPRTPHTPLSRSDICSQNRQEVLTTRKKLNNSFCCSCLTRRKKKECPLAARKKRSRQQFCMERRDRREECRIPRKDQTDSLAVFFLDPDLEFVGFDRWKGIQHIFLDSHQLLFLHHHHHHHSHKSTSSDPK